MTTSKTDTQRSVFICGQHEPWTQAVTTALSMVTDLHAHPVPGISAEEIIKCMRRHGRYPDQFSEDICLITLLASPKQTAQQGIATLLKLRGIGSYCWAGGILIVVKNEEARISLAEADLFGGAPGGPNAFGRRRGPHRILVEPLALIDLLAETSSIEYVGRNEWNDWIRESPLREIDLMVKDIKSRLREGRRNEAIPLYADLHALWRNVRWPDLSPHGPIRDLALAVSNSVTPQTAADISGMLENTLEVLHYFGLGE